LIEISLALGFFFSRYAYVMGSPISFVDSLGLASVDLSSGYTGRVETLNYGGNASFEIHVYDPRGADVPPRLSSTTVWSPILNDKEIGREEALYRRTDHWLPA
jgi:hypothetical protein